METFYIFSMLDFKIIFNNKEYNIGEKAYCRITSILPDSKIIVKNNCGELEINLRNLKTNNNFRVFNQNGNTFIEILGTGFCNVLEKHKTKNCEVVVYNNSVRLFYDEICYTYSFENSSQKSLAFEHENNLHLINNVNTLIFNLQNRTFTLCNTENYKKTKENAEILLKIPKISNYFVYFLYNAKNNSVKTKKLKMEKDVKNSLIFELFYLAKFNFSNEKRELDKDIDYNQIK